VKYQRETADLQERLNIGRESIAPGQKLALTPAAKDRKK